MKNYFEIQNYAILHGFVDNLIMVENMKKSGQSISLVWIPSLKFKSRTDYRTRATISRSRFEAALFYKPRILSLKNEEFPFLVHKLSVI